MLRAIVAKRVLDRLIREKLIEVCKPGVTAQPIVWRQRVGIACNWEIPGWNGERVSCTQCQERVDGYLKFLESQFDITDEVPLAAD